MKRLLIAASLLALAAPVAQAQQGTAAGAGATAAETETVTDKFLVFFGLNESRLTPEAMRLGTRLALTELLMSGVTTTSDHHYLFPAGLDDARRTGRTSRRTTTPRSAPTL